MTTNQEDATGRNGEMLEAKSATLLASSLSSTSPTKPTKPTKSTILPTSSSSSCVSSITLPREKLPTIIVDPGILCFHHCSVKVFCFTLPTHCPQCKKSLNQDSQPAAANNNNNYINNHQNNNIYPANSRTYNRSVFNDDIDADHNHDEHDTFDNNNVNVGQDQQSGFAASEKDASNNCRSKMNQRMEFIEQRLLPFRLPFPFVRASQHPCSIVLRPTSGDFLNDYNNTTDLHIAVTDSQGSLIEFDRHGLRRHPRRDDLLHDEWRQSLLVVGDIPEPWHDYWDQVLHEICASESDKWTISQYHEDDHNCYSFVLNFLQKLEYGELSMAADSKRKFCERYIVPRTTTAGKYISLYRKLRLTDIYVHHQTNSHYNKFMKQQQQQQQPEEEERLHSPCRRSSKMVLSRIINATERLKINSQDTKLKDGEANNYYTHRHHHHQHHKDVVGDDVTVTVTVGKSDHRHRNSSTVIGNKNGYIATVTSAPLLNSARTASTVNVLGTIEE